MKTMILSKKQRLIILIPAGILVVLSLFFILRRIIPKAINSSDCITLTVDKGDVFDPIIATGTVEAENEVLIQSPYTSIVKQIIKEPGTRVLKGDVILIMEDENIKEEIDKLKDQLDLKQMKAEEQGLTLGIHIQEKEMADKVNILVKMRVTAPSNGIVLSVSNKVGEKVEKDHVLIRMSDLSTFKVAGSVDDKLADYIKTGKKVYVVIDSERLPGSIGIVTPIIENNKIQFNVHLEAKSNPKLIANQNIVLWVVDNEAENTLRIKNLNIFEKEVPNVLYVLNNGEAIRREIKTGLRNPDYIQVLSGLEAGEKVIIPKNGMSAFHNSSSVVINN